MEKPDATVASDLRFPTNFAQYTPAVSKPSFDVVEEWEVFWGLARAMGTEWDLARRIGMPIPIDLSGSLPKDQKPTSDELWGLLCASGRVSLDEVRTHPHGVAPDLAPLVISPPDPANGDRFALADESMMTELQALAGETSSAPQQFRLISRRMWEFHNSWGQNIAALRDKHSPSPAFMNPVDLDRLGVGSGGRVRVRSTTGELETTVVAASDVREGVVSMTHCWGSENLDADPAEDGSCTNRLVDSETDLSQIVGMARQSAIPVDVVRIDEG